jgi:hypothetical protein
MQRRTARALPLIIATALATTLTGCSNDAPPVTTTTSTSSAQTNTTDSTDVVGVDAPQFDGELDQPTEPQSTSVTIEPGQAIRVDFGEVSSSVGFTWKLDDGFNHDVVAVDGVETRSQNSDPDVVGGWSWAWSTITSVGPGTTEVVYSRWWRGEQMSTFTVEVTVR